ncbi:hypothetical protein HZH68_015124 [Vespula germanica]|uniref:Uncharacterized protein n=1 Tax=Vespula germanica TaxID=30212 RepID=A0A834J8B9_VESGE|nr:hypothetical protein HZH68_015124 [Vespula germanica]
MQSKRKKVDREIRHTKQTSWNDGLLDIPREGGSGIMLEAAAPSSFAAAAAATVPTATATATATDAGATGAGATGATVTLRLSSQAS